MAILQTRIQSSCCGYESCDVRELRQIDVAAGYGYVAYIETAEHRADESTLGHSSPHDTTFATCCSIGVMIRFSPGKSGNLEVLACR
jgi:hypothetical protein